jgi:hypothetical protein
MRDERLTQLTKTFETENRKLLWRDENSKHESTKKPNRDSTHDSKSGIAFSRFKKIRVFHGNSRALCAHREFQVTPHSFVQKRK